MQLYRSVEVNNSSLKLSFYHITCSLTLIVFITCYQTFKLAVFWVNPKIRPFLVKPAAQHNIAKLLTKIEIIASVQHN